MDDSGEHIVTMEAQRSTREPANEPGRVRRYSSLNLANNIARVLTICSRSFNSFLINYSTLEEEEEEEKEKESEIELNTNQRCTNRRWTDLYDLPGEYVHMNPMIFSSMRAGDICFFESMKSYETPMSCYKDDRGDSILHLAAALGHLVLVKNILSECPCLLLEPNLKDQLPIHVAARGGHSEVVDALVQLVSSYSAILPEEYRERLNVYVLKDINGDTALHLALKDDLEKTELLENQKRTRRKTMYNMIMSYWLSNSLTTSTSLTLTASCLVKANPRASFLANEDGISPLYWAVEAGNVSLVEEMMNHPGNIVQGNASNLASQLEGRRSLVHAALKAKNKDVLDAILKKDSSLVNERDEDGRTCLSVGASVGFYEGIRELLERSTSNVYECDDDGSFPIHMAVEKGHIKVVKEILKCCPDSIELLNKHGQNILHIAAKSGKVVSFLMSRTKKHLIEEKDVDGNIPLHLAVINWRPRTIITLTMPASTKTKILNIKNNGGLRALDIAEINLQPDYEFRERLTLMVLLCVYPSRGINFLPMSGMTLRSRSEQPGCGKKYKDVVNVLLLVATLVATVTFTAGFTMPGGFSSSGPNMGMAILAKKPFLAKFLITDAVAMQSSIVAIIALIWAQLGDQELAHKAFSLALPSLFVALWCMQLAFFTGVCATIMEKKWLLSLITIIFMISASLSGALLAAYVIPQVLGIPFGQDLTGIFLIVLCYFVNEDDDEKHETSSSEVRGILLERDDQMGKSKVLKESSSEIP